MAKGLPFVRSVLVPRSHVTTRGSGPPVLRTRNPSFRLWKFFFFFFLAQLSSAHLFHLGFQARVTTTSTTTGNLVPSPFFFSRLPRLPPTEAKTTVHLWEANGPQSSPKGLFVFRRVGNRPDQRSNPSRELSHRFLAE